MTMKVSTVFGVSAVMTLCSGCCTTKQLQKPPGDVDVSSVVQQIQKAIDPFWDSNDKGLPPLSSVKVALQTVNDNKVSGEVDYLVVALQGYHDSAMTQEVDITLVPQKPATSHILARELNLSQALSDEIAAAQHKINATYASGAHILTTQEVDVELEFAVTWDVSAGVSQWKILPISLSASDEYSRSTTNTITVAFSAPSK